MAANIIEVIQYHFVRIIGIVIKYMLICSLLVIRTIIIILY